MLTFRLQRYTLFSIPMPKRTRHSVKVQRTSKMKTEPAGLNGRQKVISTCLLVGIWRCAEGWLSVRNTPAGGYSLLPDMRSMNAVFTCS